LTVLILLPDTNPFSFDGSSVNSSSSDEDPDFEQIAQTILAAGVEPVLQHPQVILEEIHRECEHLCGSKQVSNTVDNRLMKIGRTKSKRKITVRKRNQNRQASLKYRKKKKYERILAEVEIEELLIKNEQLKKGITDTLKEICYYRSQITH